VIKQIPFEISGKVREALAESRPVIALESTIIAHGMPFPQNLQTANELEDIARQEGVVPATIAVIKGVPVIGLTDEELQHLADPKSSVMKLSTRDIPFAVSKGLSGATTVAATMYLAAMAGINVFATGGIGGVHRFAEKTFDISADLTELARTKVAVVCAGAKAILDIPKTLEFLETYSVPVIGYGTEEFPAFYSRDSGEQCPHSFCSVDEIAHFLEAQWGMGLPSGAIVANPIPVESAIPREEIDPVISRALREAQKEGISGKATTPFLLKRLAELTQGRSLTSNIALVKNNVKVAAKLACALKLSVVNNTVSLYERR
jgi:pseudouridylate synthase